MQQNTRYSSYPYMKSRKNFTTAEGGANDIGIPEMVDKNGSHIQMPTMIFQYGLGAYDLWLLTNEQHYLDKAVGVTI